MGRIVKLMFVEGLVENHNKYYNMTENSDGTWTAHWGRVGNTGETQVYSMDCFEKKLKEKVKKGYKEITDLVSIQTLNEPASAKKAEPVNGFYRPLVRDLVNYLVSCAKGVIQQNYTVKVADVTEKQLAAAQSIVDSLVAKAKEPIDKKEINTLLIELYTILPRKMSNTKKFLLQEDQGLKELLVLIDSEQKLLDVMSAQVATQSQTVEKDDKEETTNSFIDIREATKEELEEIRKSTDLDFSNVSKIFAVTNKATEKIYNDYFKKHRTSKEVLYYHGSRTQNWWSILNQGLKIRPANAIHSGSMFGDGIYGANKAQKSIGYTDGGYWTGSNSSNKRYLALFRFNVGKVWNIFDHGQRYSYDYSSLNVKKCQANGFDSVFAKGGVDLRNDEAIVYESERVTIKYLIELKN